MTVNRGNKHKYIGMKLDYPKEGACQITIFENLKAILETFDKIDTKEKCTKKSAAVANLFTVQEYRKKLDTKLWYKCFSLLNVLVLTQEQQSNF